MNNKESMTLFKQACHSMQVSWANDLLEAALIYPTRESHVVKLVVSFEQCIRRIAESRGDTLEQDYRPRPVLPR